MKEMGKNALYVFGLPLIIMAGFVLVMYVLAYETLSTIRRFTR